MALQRGWPALCLAALFALTLGAGALQAAPPPTPAAPTRTQPLAPGLRMATPAATLQPPPPPAKPGAAGSPTAPPSASPAPRARATPLLAAAVAAPAASTPAAPSVAAPATPAPLLAAAQPQVSGEFSETVNGAPSLSFTLNGRDQSANYTLPITLIDKRRNGAGWNLTVTSKTYSTGGAAPRTLSTAASRVTGASASCNAGNSCTAPTNLVAYPFVLPAGAVAPAPIKLFNAALGTGEGKFTVTPTINVALPANAYAGTYHTTITLALVSGP